MAGYLWISITLAGIKKNNRSMEDRWLSQHLLCDSIPSTYIKCWAWWHKVIITALKRQRCGSLVFAGSLAYMVSPGPVRDPDSETKVDGSRGTTPEADLCPPYTHAPSQSSLSIFPLRKAPLHGRPMYPNRREREAVILSSYAGVLMVRKRALSMWTLYVWFVVLFSLLLF